MSNLYTMTDISVPSLKAILYDLDGLIVDTEPLHFRAFQITLARRGVELPSSIMADLIGYDQVKNLQDLKQLYSLSDSVEDLLTERMQAYEEVLLSASIPALAGFWDIDAVAKQLGLRRVVVTSSTHRQMHIILTRLFESIDRNTAYQSYFDDIVTGDDVTETKPAPDLYLLALRKLGLSADECFALEDTHVGVSAAVAAGIRCLAVPSQYAHVDQFAGQFAILASLHDVLPYLTNGHAGDRR
jgi:beta-phosphoglucomutase-like phosphatase (HAD superfamily)